MVTLRSWRSVRLFQALVCVVAFSLAWLQVSPAYGIDVSLRRETARQEAWRLAHLPHVALAPGLTQTPDAALQKKIAAKQAAQTQKPKPMADVRPLSAAEMGQTLGRGPLRNPYLAGAPMPWHRSLQDVNLSTGNLFKSFTDVQVAPARGAGLVLQRTYNSNDARVGPFGIGWTHAYDIRIQEAADMQTQSGDPNAVPLVAAGSNASPTTVNEVPRTDFFGAKQTYHRDADGLYSPPPYLFDEMSSAYGKFLVNGPAKVMSDTDKGMDGTIKHYTSVVTKADGTSGNERACDYIQDRYGNKTTLTYGLSYVQADGSTRSVLTQVTDPTGRTLTFQWTNFGTTTQPTYRITEVDAPTDLTTGTRAYRVTYAYYVGTEAASGGAAYQLKSVTTDPDGLNRTTTYTYTTFASTYYMDQNGDTQTATEVGLLASVADPLGHTVSYQYSPFSYCNQNNDTSVIMPGTMGVSQVSEPASSGFLTWNLNLVGSPYGGGLSVFVYINRTPTANPNNYFCESVDFATYSDTQYRHWQILQGAVVRYATNFASSIVGGDAQVAYDNSNNVQTNYWEYVHNNNFDFIGFWNNATDYTYGQHGNVLTQADRETSSQSGLYPSSRTSYPGPAVTSYYNASQYFTKQSATDPNGHTTTMGVGTNTAGKAGDPDANIGDRGQTLWVQDAGYSDSASPSYHKQFTYTYNVYGQKLSETNLNGTVTRYYYGGDGSSFAQADVDADDTGDLIAVVQDPGGTGHLNRTTTMRYDIMGRMLQSTDPMGLTSTFTYNTLGQPLTVQTPAKGSTVAETISYAYDGNGRTHSVSDNRGMTVIAYENGNDRVSSVTDPVTGTISYTYTSLGERHSMTLPGGGTWTYTYKSDASSTFNWPYTMPKDDPSDVSELLTKITDDQGRIVETGFDFSGDLYNVRSDEVYNNSGTLVSSLQTTYQDIGYPSDGPLVYVPPGQSPPNGPPLLCGRFWLARIQTTWAGQNTSQQPIHQIVSENDYTYDNAGQRLSNTVSSQLKNADGSGQVDANNNPVMTIRTENYTYDDLNRLSTVNYGDGETQSYGFDPMGNRLTKTDTAGSTTASTAYNYDAANRLTSTATNGAGASAVTSDADSNTLTDSTGRTMTWDSQNRMRSCAYNGTTSTFTYGADGLRRSETANGITTYYVYDGQTLIREMHQNVQTGALYNTTTYLTGPRGMEYRRDDTATELDSQGRQVSKTRWYVYDGLGSVVGEVDPSGNLTSSPKYDVYGLVRSNPGTASSAMGFVGGLGHLSEAATGLIYMKARYYDPALGRFSSEDPALNGTNWFVYAGDNPINCVDTTGKANVWIEGGAAIMGLACLTAALLSPIPAAIDYAIKACTWFGIAIVFGAAENTPLSVGETAVWVTLVPAYFKEVATMIVSTKVAQNFGIAQLDVVLAAVCAEGFTLIGEMAFQDAGY